MQTALIHSPQAALSVIGVAMNAAFVVPGMRPISPNPKLPR